MPITPLHLGPGTVLKAALGQHMSLSVFAFCQFTMDLEVLARISLGVQQRHGFTNTLVGANGDPGAVGVDRAPNWSGVSAMVELKAESRAGAMDVG